MNEGVLTRPRTTPAHPDHLCQHNLEALSWATRPPEEATEWESYVAILDKKNINNTLCYYDYT